MKKIISILIALAMLVSMIPSVFAEGEGETPIVEDYKFDVGKTSSTYFVKDTKPESAEVIERKIGDKTYYIYTKHHTNYGDFTWRWLAVNDETIAKAADYEGRVFRVFANASQNFLQLNLGYKITDKPYGGTDPTLELALAFKAPAKTAFYYPSIHKEANQNPTSYYLRKLDAKKITVDDYAESAHKATFTSFTGGFNGGNKINKALYTAAGDEFVLAMKGYIGEYRFDKVSLTEILNPTIKFDKTAYSFNIGDSNTADDKVSVEVSVSGLTLLPGKTATETATFGIANDFLVFKSKNESVAKFSDDGTLIAVAKGSTNIWAETKDGAFKTDEIPVTVKGKLAGRKYILNYDTTDLGEATSLSDVKDYGTRGWKCFDVADKIEENKNNGKFIAQVSSTANGLIFYLKNNSACGPLAYALSLQTPEKAAFYVPEFDTYINSSSGNVIDWYMSFPDNARKTVEEYCVDENKILTTEKIKYSDHPIQIADAVVYTIPGEEIISAMSAPYDSYKFFYIQLAELLNPELKIALGKTSLDISEEKETTISAKISGTTNEETVDRTITDKKIAPGSIVYKSDNSAVATVSADGTVTAISSGVAKIHAESKDGLVKSNEVTVTVSAPAAPEEDEELKAAFGAKTEAANTYVESTVTGLTDDSTITAKKNSNGTFSLTAPETKNDAKFLYWAKGMSKNKKIVSFSNVLSDYMPEENGKNYLIAVYEGDISETAEYYNANGQRIATGTEPALPSMAGYGKASGWAKFGETNIYVAEYGNKTIPDNVTVTVDGKAQTVPYGTKIICKADESKANFKCWKKSDINGKTEIVSAEKNYAFNAWESCTVESVYEEHFYTGAKLKIIIDTFTVGNDTAVMAEFVGLGNAVEKGIMYNGRKIAMTKPGNQFTVTADNGGAFAGYAIIGNADDGYTLITDGSVTIGE